MPATTSTDLAALIPDEVISGVVADTAGDSSTLINLCAVQRGSLHATFNEMAPFAAATVGEGAALAPAAVTPIGTTITATHEEVPAVQITRTGLAQQQYDWLNLGGGLGRALRDRINAQVCATFDDLHSGNRDSIASTDGAGNAAPLDLHALELALRSAEGDNALAKPYGEGTELAIVLHPKQIAEIRAAVRASGNYIARADVISLFPALPQAGLAFMFYGVPVYSSVGVASGAFAGAAGAGVALQTGVALAAGNTYKGAIMAVGSAVGFNMTTDPNVRMADEVLIGGGGMNLVAGYVGAAARFSHYLGCIESAA